MKQGEIHEECKMCIHLRIFSLDMGGNHTFCCNRTPNYVEQDRHKFPCPRFEREFTEENTKEKKINE